MPEIVTQQRVQRVEEPRRDQGEVLHVASHAEDDARVQRERESTLTRDRDRATRKDVGHAGHREDGGEDEPFSSAPPSATAAYRAACPAIVPRCRARNAHARERKLTPAAGDGGQHRRHGRSEPPSSTSAIIAAKSAVVPMKAAT